MPMTPPEVVPGTMPPDHAVAVCQMPEVSFQTESTTSVVSSVSPSPPVARVKPSAVNVPADTAVTA